MAHTPVTSLAQGARNRGQANRREPDSKIVLDSLSKQIIEQLQQDGRRSYASIGKAVGLSPLFNFDQQLCQVIGTRQASGMGGADLAQVHLASPQGRERGEGTSQRRAISRSA